MCHNVSRVLWRDGLSSASSFRRSVLAAWTSAACHEAARSTQRREAIWVTCTSWVSLFRNGIIDGLCTHSHKRRKMSKTYQRLSKIIKDYQSIKTYRSFFWTMQISDSPALLKASCTPSNSSRLVMVWELKGGTNFLGRICMTCRYATDVKSPTSKFATMSSSN